MLYFILWEQYYQDKTKVNAKDNIRKENYKTIISLKYRCKNS